MGPIPNEPHSTDVFSTSAVQRTGSLPLAGTKLILGSRDGQECQQEIMCPYSPSLTSRQILPPSPIATRQVHPGKDGKSQTNPHLGHRQHSWLPQVVTWGGGPPGLPLVLEE